MQKTNKTLLWSIPKIGTIEKSFSIVYWKISIVANIVIIMNSFLRICKDILLLQQKIIVDVQFGNKKVEELINFNWRIYLVLCINVWVNKDGVITVLSTMWLQPYEAHKKWNHVFQTTLAKLCQLVLEPHFRICKHIFTHACICSMVHTLTHVPSLVQEKTYIFLLTSQTLTVIYLKWYFRDLSPKYVAGTFCWF